MRFQSLSFNEAKCIVDQYDSMDDIEFEELINRWKNYEVSDVDTTYYEFRNSLVGTFKEALDETNGKVDSHYLDLKVGLCLYTLLPIGDSFTLIDANNDGIWRYISLKILPDITYIRYPKPAKGDIRICSKRFYSATRRIWLKTLWWYIYLSWQGTKEATYEILKENSVDNINKLIETPGKGYRLDLYRNLVREYGETFPHNAKDFAAMTKLNNVKCLSVEPSLVIGGEESYAKQLLSEVNDIQRRG